jgi:CheY-like chemotaxis protein
MKAPTVLAIDDTSDDLVLLRLACADARVSFRLQSVESGENAIAYLARSHLCLDQEGFPYPDLILLDLKMPGKSGFDVLAWIRGQPGLNQLPVIVLTSSIHPEDRSRALELGANHFLVKPVDYAALKEFVRIIDDALTLNQGVSPEAIDMLDSKQSAPEEE